MSTLKVTHLQNENGTGPAMSIAVGGGVTFAGISTFHSAVKFPGGIEDGLQVSTGATISGSTNVITASTNGSERLRINSSGNVGIGTDNPYAKNHIEIDVNAGAGSGSAGALWLKNANQTANNSATIFFGNNASQASGAINFIHKDYSTNAGDITFDTRTNGSTYAERLRIGSDGTSAFTSSSSTRTATFTGNGVDVIHSAGSNIFLGTQTGSDGKIGTENNANLHLYANGYGNRITVNTSGNLSIVDGNLVVANGHGIDFSANANATGMTSELLDDYEEGTYSPAWVAATGVTYTSQEGQYIKIGKHVYVWGEFSFTTFTAFPNGWDQISLPYVGYRVSGMSGSISTNYWAVAGGATGQVSGDLNFGPLGHPNGSATAFTNTFRTGNQGMGNASLSTIFTSSATTKTIRFNMCYATG